MIIVKYGIHIVVYTKEQRCSKNKCGYKTMRLNMNKMINDLSNLTIYNRLSN